MLEGVLGLLPNRTAKQVMAEMVSAITARGGAELAANTDVHFSYRHNCSVCPTDRELVADLSSAVGQAGLDPDVGAMTASCDACFYSNLGIDTVVFGGGSLGVAHSNNEHMPIAQLAAAGKTLANLAARWCERERL